MAARKLIIEVYEYTDDTLKTPDFSYIPCDLSTCLQRKDKTSLKEIIQKGFDSLPRSDRDSSTMQDVIRKLEEAELDRITVTWNPEESGADSFIELNNVVPVRMSDADARRIRNRTKDIILYGKYQFANENETTILKDAQRLTLIYSSQWDLEAAEDMSEPAELDDSVHWKEVCLNITYLQG